MENGNVFFYRYSAKWDVNRELIRYWNENSKWIKFCSEDSSYPDQAKHDGYELFKYRTVVFYSRNDMKEDLGDYILMLDKRHPLMNIKTDPVNNMWDQERDFEFCPVFFKSLFEDGPLYFLNTNLGSAATIRIGHEKANDSLFQFFSNVGDSREFKNVVLATILGSFYVFLIIPMNQEGIEFKPDQQSEDCFNQWKDRNCKDRDRKNLNQLFDQLISHGKRLMKSDVKVLTLNMTRRGSLLYIPSYCRVYGGIGIEKENHLLIHHELIQKDSIDKK